MLKRYIGPFNVASVTAAGRNLGSVEKGEVLYVPNDVADSVGWPESSWESVTNEKTSDKGEAE